MTKRNEPSDPSSDAEDLETRIRASEDAMRAGRGELAPQLGVNGAGAAGAVVGGVMGSAFGHPEAGAALGSVLFTTAASVMLAAYKRAESYDDERRAAQFFNEATRRGVRMPDDPADRERFVRVLRARLRDALEALDDHVVPSLVALLERYQDRPRDPFFRSLARVLRELSAEEHEDLRTLVGWMLATVPEDWPPAVRLVFFEHAWSGARAWARDGERAVPAFNTARASPWPPPVASWPLLSARLRAEAVLDRITIERANDRPADAIAADSLRAMAAVLAVDPTKGPAE